MNRPRSVGEVLGVMKRPRISVVEAGALQLGSRVLAEVAEALARSGRTGLAEESANSAMALDDLRQRAVVARDDEGGRGEVRS